ncbi:FAD binding domain-containing protein [Paucibacter sp. APW11]|uniref:FAD binding domain-containing protein n=1 Tax=Roseateles aquae TaxID=3077235 RepID=A0ABU3PJQ0_9BURK|nr:FAD binding domain-containing protein [Paucibacter sp. APW11]MDT9002392.1 FAD binding domain-containing protein [Paucibacter sp. APW11]
MSFSYTHAATLADAARAAAQPDAKVIAGGQSLLGAIKLGLSAPEALIDLSTVLDLKGIRLDNGRLVIGAMSTHATVAASKEVQAAIPALAALADQIGDRQVRNRGTLGGSLANNDPAACYPAAVLGLGATIHTDRRSIAADDFFKGLYETALQDGEIISSVSFPVPEKAGWQKFKQPASRFSIVGVFVSRGPAGVRVAVTGAGPGVFRATAIEQALTAQWSAASASAVTISPEGLNSDLHGSAAYRAALIPVLASRAVA